MCLLLLLSLFFVYILGIWDWKKPTSFTSSSDYFHILLSFISPFFISGSTRENCSVLGVFLSATESLLSTVLCVCRLFENVNLLKRVCLPLVKFIFYSGKISINSLNKYLFFPLFCLRHCYRC